MNPSLPHRKIPRFLGVILLTAFFSLHSNAQSRPNIVIILADDLGYGDVQCYNPQRGKISTPNINRLASEGMRFTDAHSSSGICSPSRYSLLTGRYHWRSRMQEGLINFWDLPLITPERLTIGGLAKKQGYRTAAIGKWHIGWNWPIELDEQAHFTRYGSFEAKSDSGKRFEPTLQDLAAWKKTFSQRIDGGPVDVGFDYYFGTDVPNWPPFCFIENDRTVGIPTEFLRPGQVNINQASFQGPALKDWKLEEILPTLRDKAIAFIGNQAKAKQPFLLYLPLTSPHTPLAVNPEWKNKSGLNNDYADFVMETDEVVGRVLEALEKNGIANNTLVIFTSDNGCGPYIGVKDLELRGHYPSGPLRGYKGDAWEGGHRLPFIVKMPGVVKPGSACDQLISQTDIMATISDIFGKKLQANEGEDSYSMMPLLKGSKLPIRKNAINCRYDGLQSVRDGSWKLICTSVPELYNLANDIGETKNVAAEYPDKVVEILALRKKLINDGRGTPGVQQKNDVEVNID